MRTNVLSSLIVMLACSIACAQESRSDAWKHDIEYLKTELPGRHKNLFFSMDQETYEARLDEIIAGLANMSDMEIVISLQKVLAETGDDHTSIEYRRIVQNAGVFPLQLYWFSDGLHVQAALSEHESLLGSKVTAINRIPITEVIDRLSSMMPRTNDALIRHRVPNILSLIGLLQHFEIIEGESASVEFIGQDKAPKSLLIEKLDPRTLGPSVRFVTCTPDSLPLCRRNPGSYFWSEFLDEDRVLYVQYNRCWSRELEEKHGSKERAAMLPSFADFTAETVDALNKPGVEKCILDLRFNPGGSSPQGTELARKIGEISRINRKGRLFVIIGRRTYSSAVINAIDFKKHTEAILVGEPTSGRPNHFGEVQRFTLPKTGLPVSYSTKYFKYLDDDPDSLMPDITVETSFEDYASGKDPVLDAIKNYREGRD